MPEFQNATSVLSCPHMGEFAWQHSYLTESVYRSSLVAAILNACLIPLTVSANVCVLTAMFKTSSLKKKIRIFLLFLSATDLLTSVFAQPLFVISSLFQISGSGPICALDTAYSTTLLLSRGSSLFLVTVATVECYITLKYSLTRDYVITVRRLWAAYISATLLGTLLAVMPFLDRSQRFSDFFTCVAVFACVFIVIFCYIYIYKVGSRHKFQIASQMLCDQKAIFLKECRLTATVAMVTGQIFLSYVPATVTMATLQLIDSYDGRTLFVVLPWGNTLVLLNSLSNPVVYSWFHKDIRQTITATLSCFTRVSISSHQEVLVRELVGTSAILATALPGFLPAIHEQVAETSLRIFSRRGRVRPAGRNSRGSNGHDNDERSSDYKDSSQEDNNSDNETKDVNNGAEKHESSADHYVSNQDDNNSNNETKDVNSGAEKHYSSADHEVSQEDNNSNNETKDVNSGAEKHYSNADHHEDSQVITTATSKPDENVSVEISIKKNMNDGENN